MPLSSVSRDKNHPRKPPEPFFKLSGYKRLYPQRRPPAGSFRRVAFVSYRRIVYSQL